MQRVNHGLEHPLPRHPSFFDDSSRARFFAPVPERIRGPFVAISPLNGRLAALEKLWYMLAMDPEFETATIVFAGDYLRGPHARQLMSLLCTLRLAHPSPIFLSGPNDLAAAAYLGLLKNLELSVALNAVGTSWAEENHEVFASYGVTTHTATALLNAMPPEHREFLTELAVSIKHDDITLTAMLATTLAASSLTSDFASDFFTLPHPLHAPTTPLQSAARSLPTLLMEGESRPLAHSPSAARGSSAASIDGDELLHHTNSDVDMPDSKAVVKTMYVDPMIEFPAVNADGLAMNGSGVLAALFYPSGRVCVSHPSQA